MQDGLLFNFSQYLLRQLQGRSKPLFHNVLLPFGSFLPSIGETKDKYGRVPLIAPAALLCGLGCFGVASAEVWELFVASYVFLG